MNSHEQRRLDWAFSWCLRHLESMDRWLGNQPKQVRRILAGKLPFRQRIFPAGMVTREQRAIFLIQGHTEKSLRLLEEQLEVLAYYRPNPIYIQALRQLDQSGASLRILEMITYETFDGDAFLRVLDQIRENLGEVACMLRRVEHDPSPVSRLPIPYSRTKWRQLIEDKKIADFSASTETNS